MNLPGSIRVLLVHAAIKDLDSDLELLDLDLDLDLKLVDLDLTWTWLLLDLQVCENLSQCDSMEMLIFLFVGLFFTKSTYKQLV